MNTVDTQTRKLPGRRTRNGNTCKVLCFNADKVQAAQNALPNKIDLDRLTELYETLGSVTRLKIIFALSAGDICVCDIAHVLGLSIPATSHQLKYLHEKGVLQNRSDGKMVYYSLHNGRLASILRGDVRFLEELVRG